MTERGWSSQQLVRKTKKKITQSKLVAQPSVAYFSPNTSVFQGRRRCKLLPSKEKGKKENSDADLTPPTQQQQPRGLTGSAAVRGLCAANPPVCAAGSFDRWSCQALRHALLQLQKENKQKKKKDRVCRARRQHVCCHPTSAFAHLAL